MNRKKEIIKMINAMSGSMAPYEIFNDWVKLMALGIQNSCFLFRNELWKKREEDYLQTIKPYGEDGKIFPQLAGILTGLMEDNMRDHLGEIYMELGGENKNAGQFFTPFPVSEVAGILVLNYDAERRETVKLNEPSCGSGGMIIATAKSMKKNGINYQHLLRVVAQDLDWKAVYMCYVQLSLLGINAVMVQGDTLMEPYIKNYPPERTFYTPRKMGVIM